MGTGASRRSPPPTPSTGPPREPSPQSRTKDSADRAGPSPPPVPSRVPTRLLAETSSLSLSKTSSPAIRSTTDARAVSWTTPSNGSNRTEESAPKLTTHTPLEPDHPERARRPARTKLPSPVSRMSQARTRMPSPQPSPSSPSLSPSRPTSRHSSSTSPESSPPQPAVPSSITVFLPSDTEPSTERSTGRSRTPGAQPGVTKDTFSSLVEPTSAVSLSSHPTQPALKPPAALPLDLPLDLPPDLPLDLPLDLPPDLALRPTTVILSLDPARATRSTSLSPASPELSARQSAPASLLRPSAHPTFLRESPPPQRAPLRTPAATRSTAHLSAPRTFTSPRLRTIPAARPPARPSHLPELVSAPTITKQIADASMRSFLTEFVNMYSPI